MKPARLAGPLQGHFDRLLPAWRDALEGWMRGPGRAQLCAFVDGRIAAGATVYPPEPLAALAHLVPAGVRVVILGQDPYHGPGQAHGFAFSVPAGVAAPPSLRNIRREAERDTGAARAPTDLRSWAGQGVLLLNSVLTVEDGQPGAHARRGWEAFTDAVIDALALDPSPRVYLLWGAQAQAKRARIEAGSAPRLVLLANHPSPLSATRPPIPFHGCGHFSQANAFLGEHGLPPIDWGA
jgi:uracil-DNA glycosylase